MTSITSTGNIAFQGNNIKKTPRGNEYKTTHMGRTTGAAVGLLSGALAAHMQAKRIGTKQGKRELIQSLNNIGKSLNVFGSVKDRKGYISIGLKVLAAGIAAAGMFVGAAVGGTIDSHNNHNRAKEADKAAKA